ncbi:HET-domain-containing protein [Nemania sp. FL0031]|nr:HET-domain-containing protein [Nemania sp. FL0031]
MRLINTRTHHVEEFFHNIPPYAILSHTWGSEEVNFQEYLLAIGPDANRYAHIRRKAGFSKIIGACVHAQRDRLDYVWCDTNCIDKTSSAELSEAINSMYAWYRDSVVCYAFLADVDTGVGMRADFAKKSGPFTKSRWFTRGWTLQELLAPKKVIFFDKLWRILGNRADLAETLSDITRIHIGALQDRNSIPKYSIAQRMSWAAGRHTSRQEDIAYSLLGIFGINMPLLYGEGQRSFIRLQEEIIKVSDDQSILAWEALSGSNRSQASALALSPSVFLSSGSLVSGLDTSRWPYSITNIGISMELPVICTSLKGTILVGLNCAHELRAPGSQNQKSSTNKAIARRFQVWIWLKVVGSDIYERIHSPASRSFLEELYPEGARRTMTRLFLKTSISDWPDTQAPTIHPTPFSNPIPQSKFLVVISFGQLRQRTRTFETVFPPGNFSICRMEPIHSPSGVEVEIVSAGSYNVLLSVIHNPYNGLEHGRHVVFTDPDGTIRRELATSNRKGGLNESDELYECISKLSVDCSDIKQEPSVYMEQQIWQDLHNFPRLVVHVTFQELRNMPFGSTE